MLVSVSHHGTVILALIAILLPLFFSTNFFLCYVREIQSVRFDT